MKYSMLDILFNHTTQNSFFIFLIVFIELINIFIDVVSVTCMLLKTNTENNFIQNMSKISLSSQIQKLYTCNIVNTNYNLCTFAASTQIICLLLISIFSISFFLFSRIDNSSQISFSKIKNLKSKLFKQFSKFFANVLLLIFRVGGMFLLLIFINFTLYFIYALSLQALATLQNVPYTVFIFLCSSIFYCLLIHFYIIYLKHLNISLIYDKELAFHSDNIFSKNFDYFLIFLKILITLENNFILFEMEANSKSSLDMSNKIFLLGVLIIFSLFAYIFFLFFILFKKNILFIVNKNINLFRIFLICFTCFFLLFLITFNSKIDDAMIFSLSLVSILIASFISTKYFNQKNEENIFQNKILVNQIAYVISEKNYLSEKELGKVIFNIVMIHKMNCNKTTFSDNENILITESNCKICNENSHTFESFLNSFYFESKLNIITNGPNSSQEEKELFTMIELFHFNFFNEKNFIRFYFQMTKILKNSAQDSKSLSLLLNINRLKKLISKKNLEDMVRFKMLKTLEETSGLLKKIIKISDDICANFEFEQNIFHKADEINIAREEILENMLALKNINSENKSNEDMYTLILIKNIYEEIFNTNIENYFPSSDFIEAEYKLSEKFNDDKIMIVNYDVEKDFFLISRASGDLKKFSQMKFEDMFHSEFKSLARKNFLQLIKENENEFFTFEFILKNPNPKEEIYFQNVKFRGKVFPSINFNEFIVNMKYELSTENLIVFEQNRFLSDTRYLKGMSKNIESMLCITDLMVRNLDSMKISYENIFENSNDELSRKMTREINISSRNNFQHETSKFDENLIDRIRTPTTIKCHINEMSYINFCFYINSIYNATGNEELINFKELEKLKNSKSRRNFFLKKKYSYSILSCEYEIYSINLGHPSAEDSPDNSFDFNQESDSDNNTQKLTFNIASPSVLSYMSNAEFGVSALHSSKTIKRGLGSTFNLNCLTTFISFYILSLFTYSFAFMILGILGDKNLNHSYSNLMSFVKLEKSVYQSYTILFNKFTLGYDQMTLSHDHTYNGKLVNIIKNQSNLNFEEIATLEINTTIASIQQFMLDFQSTYMNSVYKDEIDSLLDNQIDYKVISQVDGLVTTYNKTQNLLDNIKTFMNLASLISESEEIVKLDRISYNLGDIDFSSIQNKNYNNKQIYGMEIIINFLNICNQTEFVSNSLQSIENNKLNSCYSFTVTFFITFIIFHLILILVCLYIINTLSNLIANNLKVMEDIFSHKNKIHYRKKLSILKELNELYSEDPVILLYKLKQNHRLFCKFNREEIRKQQRMKKELENESIDIGNDSYTNNTNSDDNYENSQNYINGRNKFLFPIAKILFYIFILFLTYSILSFLLILGAYKKFAKGSLMFSYLNLNGNYLYRNYNSLQFMFYTNSTDANLYSLSSPGSAGEETYVKSNIKSIEKRTINISNLMKQDINFINFRLAQPKMMNCTYLYSNLNDGILNILYEEYGNNTILQNILINICHKLPVMKNKMVQYVVEEINYNMQSILFDYQTNINNLEKVIDIYNEPCLYYLYYILVYIYRPIQQYANYDLVYPVVMAEESNYLLVMLMFLGFNILVDIIIYILIKYIIIRKVLYVSKFIETFIVSMRIA